MVAANGDRISAGHRPSEAHRCGSRVGAVLSEPHRFGAGDAFHQQLGHLGFQGMGQGEGHPDLELTADRRIDVGIAVADEHRGEAVDEVEVTMTVEVHEFCTLTTRRKERRRAHGQVSTTLAEGLRSKGNASRRSSQPIFRSAKLARSAHPADQRAFKRRSSGVSSSCFKTSSRPKAGFAG